MLLNKMFYALAGRKVCHTCFVALFVMPAAQISGAQPSVLFWAAVHHLAAFIFQDIPPQREDYAEAWREHRSHMLRILFASFPDELYQSVLGYTAEHASGPWPFPIPPAGLSAARTDVLRQAAAQDPQTEAVVRQRHPSLLL